MTTTTTENLVAVRELLHAFGWVQGILHLTPRECCDQHTTPGGYCLVGAVYEIRLRRHDAQFGADADDKPSPYSSSPEITALAEAITLLCPDYQQKWRNELRSTRTPDITIAVNFNDDESTDFARVDWVLETAIASSAHSDDAPPAVTA